MDKRDKKRIVRDLCRSIEREVCAVIDSGLLPADWNGIELRDVLADAFARERYTDGFSSHNRRRMFARRRNVAAEYSVARGKIEGVS